MNEIVNIPFKVSIEDLYEAYLNHDTSVKENFLLAFKNIFDKFGVVDKRYYYKFNYDRLLKIHFLSFDDLRNQAIDKYNLPLQKKVLKKNKDKLLAASRNIYQKTLCKLKDFENKQTNTLTEDECVLVIKQTLQILTSIYKKRKVKPTLSFNRKPNGYYYIVSDLCVNGKRKRILTMTTGSKIKEEADKQFKKLSEYLKFMFDEKSDEMEINNEEYFHPQLEYKPFLTQEKDGLYKVNFKNPLTKVNIVRTTRCYNLEEANEILNGFITWLNKPSNWPKINHKKIRKSTEKKVDAFSDEQISKILELFNEFNKSFAIIIKIALNTGMSMREIINLKWEDIDFGNNIIKTEYNNKVSTPRMLPLSEDLRNILLEYKKEDKYNNYVFNLKGRNLKRHYASKVFNSGLDQCNFNFNKNRRYCFQSFKRNFVINCLKNNMDIMTLHNILGNKTMLVTENYIKDFGVEFK